MISGLAASEFPPPPKPPVMAWPIVCPTADPTATPAAVLAIWANIPGCLGAAAAGELTADAGAGAGAGGGAALAIGGGGAGREE